MPVQLLQSTFEDPCRAFDFSDLGDAELQKGDAAGALAAFNAALEVEPRWPVIWLHRAQGKLEHGDFQGAIEDASATLEHLCKSKWGFWVTAWAILSTASANHPAFDPGEKQVNKEHIGDGLTLADDPEFAKKPEAAYALEDPACEEAPGWSEYRSQLMALVAIEWQDAAALAYEWMNSRGMMKTKIMDDEAKHCLPGVVASLHLLVRFSLEEDGSWESAVYMTRCLSGYASSMHPDKFDQITANGTRWPVTVAEMDSIRRRLAVASANRTTTSWKNEAGESYVGNAFTMMGTDEVEPGISMKNSVRVYVYDVEDYFELRVLARGASFCRENQWGFEVGLHEWFLACPCRTEDPLEASCVVPSGILFAISSGISSDILTCIP
ncbi:unnamed protein product [Durusdinium trenchii]|uniref:Uncharacterized protein n=1 Tax=Durusdinium trenchii TaxID=1381693 RepID=A0ABP0NRH9_9DINO